MGGAVATARSILFVCRERVEESVAAAARGAPVARVTSRELRVCVWAACFAPQHARASAVGAVHASTGFVRRRIIALWITMTSCVCRRSARSAAGPALGEPLGSSHRAPMSLGLHSPGARRRDHVARVRRSIAAARRALGAAAPDVALVAQCSQLEARLSAQLAQNSAARRARRRPARRWRGGASGRRWRRRSASCRRSWRRRSSRTACS